MTKEYNKAYKEVLEVLKYMLQEEREKIPQKMIQMFKEKMDSNHKFKYDESKKFDEQELLIETKAILSTYNITNLEKHTSGMESVLDRNRLHNSCDE